MWNLFSHTFLMLELGGCVWQSFVIFQNWQLNDRWLTRCGTSDSKMDLNCSLKLSFFILLQLLFLGVQPSATPWRTSKRDCVTLSPFMPPCPCPWRLPLHLTFMCNHSEKGILTTLLTDHHLFTEWPGCKAPLNIHLLYMPYVKLTRGLHGCSRFPSGSYQRPQTQM